MVKTCDIDFRKGTLIDSVSKTAGTLTAGNGWFRKTEKGQAMYFDGTTVIDTNLLSNNILGSNNYVEIWFRTGKSVLTLQYLCFNQRSSGSTFQNLLINNSLLVGYYANSAGTVDTLNLKTTTYLKPFTNYHAVLTRTNTSNLDIYLNSVKEDSVTDGGQSPAAFNMFLSGTSAGAGKLEGCILRVRTGNHSPTQLEINSMYEEFLQSQITEKPVRGFELVKPTDLSRLKDDKLGTNLTDNYDFNTWASTGTAFVSKTANSFTTNGSGGGVSQSSIVTIGKKYRMTIRGTTTSGFSVTNLSVSPTYATFSVGDFNSTIDFTATTANSLYLRNTAEGTTTITHLSIQELTGIFAAYNFKRNGNTLVDISGNGNNFTLTSGILSRDGGLNFPFTNATITPPMQFPDGSKTVCWRGTVYSIPASYARIYGSYLMFNSNLSILLYRASSDSIVQIGTGFSSSQFGKEFDFVFVQEGNNSQKLYINGVLVGTSTTKTTSGQAISEIGSTGTTAGNILFKDLRFYTRAFTEAEVKAYHNSWVNPVILEDWSGSAVGDII